MNACHIFNTTQMIGVNGGPRDACYDICLTWQQKVQKISSFTVRTSSRSFWASFTKIKNRKMGFKSIKTLLSLKLNKYMKVDGSWGLPGLSNVQRSSLSLSLFIFPLQRDAIVALQNWLGVWDTRYRDNIVAPNVITFITLLILVVIFPLRTGDCTV